MSSACLLDDAGCDEARNFVVVSVHVMPCHQVRNLRALCDSKGKSVGILLLEYSDIQSVRRATEADGICRMRMLQGFGIVPRAMSVSSFAASIRS